MGLIRLAARGLGQPPGRGARSVSTMPALGRDCALIHQTGGGHQLEDTSA
jgi:hypothetical protein